MTLESLVCEVTGARAATRGERLQVLWGGYGEIRRFALAGAAADSVIVKHVKPPASHSLGAGEQARSHARKLRSYEVEQAFYLDFAPRCDAGCRVPRAHHAARTDDGFLFVLEDLDGAGYTRRRSRLAPLALTRCLDWLAHFHARFLAVVPEGLFAEGTYWHLATRPDELRRLTDAELRAAAPQLDALLAGARFRSLVHGDAKLDNFCFAASGAVAAVDFQYAGGGVGVKDVAYLLSCLDSGDCEAHAPALLDHYFATLGSLVRALHPAVDVGALESEWRALYPVAWADFTRFLLGWAPHEALAHPYGLGLTREVLAAL
jgi:hypothetical protein